MFKPLPQDVTSYDFLKSLAVVLMIVDHIGHFFYPDILWFRVIGRASMPIWFFLIGYARTRDIPKIFWWGGAVMVLSAVIAEHYFFPINILFTLGIARLLIDRIMQAALKSSDALMGVFFLISLLALPSALVFEYGTLGLLFAMLGYMRRRQEEVALDLSAQVIFGFAGAAVYIFIQSLMFGIHTSPQLMVLGVVMLFVLAFLYLFQPRVYPRLTPCAGFLKFTGRWTLEIYVGHLLLFRAIAMALYPDKFWFMEFKILPFG